MIFCWFLSVFEFSSFWLKASAKTDHDCDPIRSFPFFWPPWHPWGRLSNVLKDLSSRNPSVDGRLRANLTDLSFAINFSFEEEEYRRPPQIIGVPRRTKLWPLMMLISEYVCSNDYTTGVCPAVHRCPPWVPCPVRAVGAVPTAAVPRGTALARGGTISRGTFVSDDTKCLKSWGHCRTGLRDETRLWKMPPLPLLTAVP